MAYHESGHALIGWMLEHTDAKGRNLLGSFMDQFVQVHANGKSLLSIVNHILISHLLRMYFYFILRLIGWKLVYLRINLQRIG